MRSFLTVPLACGLLGAMASHAQTVEHSGLDELLAIPVSAASKLEQTSMRAPALVTIVTAEEIARFGWRTLGEALGSVNGLYLTYDRRYTYVGVRGVGRPTDYNNRVLVMIDGLRVNEDVFGYAGIGTDLPLDMRAIERIEIVRGPGSVTFGTAAMLAVVNVILRSPETTSERAFALEAGDFGRVAATARGVTPVRRLKVAWSAVATQTDGADLYFPEYATAEPGSGHSRDADWDRGHALALRANYQALELTAYVSERKKGFPTGAFGTTLGDRRAATTDSWSMLGVSWRRKVAPGWTLRARGQGGKYYYAGFYPLAAGSFDNSTTNAWWGTELQATWEPRPESRTTAGFEWRDNMRADYLLVDDLDNVYFDGDLPHQIAGLYLEHELQLTEGLLLTAGARYDDHSHTGGALSPRLALVYLPNRSNSLKFLAGRAIRAPNAYQLAYRDSQFDGETRPDLDDETLQSLELAWERRFSSSLFGSMSVFRYTMEELIELREDPAGGSHYDNVDAATSDGVEVELSARMPSGVWMVAGASLQQATDDRTGARLSNSPELQLNTKLSAPLGRGWRGATDLLYETGRRTVDATETDPYLLVNANLAWTSAARPFTLELQARNLFDRGYRLPGGPEHRRPALEQDGRALTLRCEVRF